MRSSARMRRSTSSPSIFGSFRSSKTTARERARVPARVRARREEVVERRGAVAHDDDLVRDAALLEGQQRQLLVAGVVLDEQDDLAHGVASDPSRRKREVEGRAARPPRPRPRCGPRGGGRCAAPWRDRSRSPETRPPCGAAGTARRACRRRPCRSRRRCRARRRLGAPSVVGRAELDARRRHLARELPGVAEEVLDERARQRRSRRSRVQMVLARSTSTARPGSRRAAAVTTVARRAPRGRRASRRSSLLRHARQREETVDQRAHLLRVRARSPAASPALRRRACRRRCRGAAARSRSSRAAARAGRARPSS